MPMGIARVNNLWNIYIVIFLIKCAKTTRRFDWMLKMPLPRRAVWYLFGDAQMMDGNERMRRGCAMSASFALDELDASDILITFEIKLL